MELNNSQESEKDIYNFLILHNTNPISLVTKVDLKKYPNTIFWFKDNTCIIEYNFKVSKVWLSNSNFWKMFDNLDDVNKIEKIENVIKKHFNFSDVTYVNLKVNHFESIEKYFNG